MITFLRYLDTWLYGTAWRLATQCDLYGFRVGVSRIHGEAQALVLDKLSAAFAMTEAHDQRVFACVRGCVRRLYVSGTGAPYVARWLPTLNMCLLTVDWVLRPDVRPANIACAIVHEATHARLLRFGYDERIRHRIERICHKQEEAFARRLEDVPEIVARAHADQQRPQGFYSDNRLRERSLTAARRFGVPALVVRIVSWVLRTCMCFKKEDSHREG